MSAFIGGNLDAIAESAGRMDQSAALAVTTGEQTKSAAETLQGAIEQAMGELVSKFNGIADEMRQDINTTHTQLMNTDWKGSSRDNAVAIKEQLQTQVNTVLNNATTTLDNEKRAFNDRATAIVESVNSEFKTVMNNVDAEYKNLANASRQTRENLLAADATIKMG